MLEIIISLLIMSGKQVVELSDYYVPLSEERKQVVEYSLELFDIDLDPAYVYTIIYKESRFQEDADNYSYGYMQIIPDYFYVYYNSLIESYPELSELENNVYDPYSNLIIGVYMLKYLSIELGYDDDIKDNFTHILAAYGKGITGARNHFRRYGTYSSSYSRDYYNVLETLQEESSFMSLDWSMYEENTT